MKKTITILMALLLVIVISGCTSYEPLNPDSAHLKGNESALVNVVEYSDFECPACAAARFNVNNIISDYGDRIRFEYKHFPLPSHSFARKAAEASECASDIGGNEKFWEYHDKLFENQNKLLVPNLKQYAADLGLDTEKFNACLDSGYMSSRVDIDSREGQSVGVPGTPTFFVNGEMIFGTLGLTDMIESKL